MTEEDRILLYRRFGHYLDQPLTADRLEDIVETLRVMLKQPAGATPQVKISKVEERAGKVTFLVECEAVGHLEPVSRDPLTQAQVRAVADIGKHSPVCDETGSCSVCPACLGTAVSPAVGERLGATKGRDDPASEVRERPQPKAWAASVDHKSGELLCECGGNEAGLCSCEGSRR